MRTPTPLVSVCIPAYNCGSYIQQSLTCLLKQTYPNFELIVVNDGSSDDTLLIAQSFNDNRIKIIDIENSGAAKARNIAFNNAGGEYIIFFDADDYIGPDFISQQIDKIDHKKNIIVLSAWGRFYNDDIDTFRYDHTPAEDMTFAQWIEYYWYNCNPMTNPGRVIIPTGLIREAGLWNEKLSLNDDMEFFTRIFLKAEKIVFNKNATFYYRSGINGLSGIKGAEAYQSLYNSIALSVKYIMSAYGRQPALLKSCANMWQLFVYDIYPLHSALVKKAQHNINELGGSRLSYPSGKLTAILVRITGWKIAKKIKSYLIIKSRVK